MGTQTNLVRLKAISQALGNLKEKVVFVGGATLSLYPDRKILEVRSTDDVDVIIELVSYAQRMELEERLRAIGFINDQQSGILCRYKINGITTDIMPTDETSIGFKNKWYSSGFKKAIPHPIDSDTTIYILSAPYFIATKMEAFKSRGKSDGLTSHDFEDIVYVLENRSVIWEELQQADPEIKSYLIQEFSHLISLPQINDWLDANVERGFPPATAFILAELRTLCS